MIVSAILEQLPGAGVGFVVGAFCPAVLRKIKAFEVNLAKKIVAKADAAAKTTVSTVATKL